MRIRLKEKGSSSSSGDDTARLRMAHRRWRTLVLIAVLSAAGTHSLASALDEESTSSTLRGLEGVHVIVEQVKPEIGAPSGTDEQLRIETETKLRLAGIRILSLGESHETEGNPRLIVSVAIMKPQASGGYVSRISVELHQTAYLARDPGIVADVATWRNETLGASLSLAEIRTRVRQLIDRFVLAYLAANPQDLSNVKPFRGRAATTALNPLACRTCTRRGPKFAPLAFSSRTAP